MLYIHDFIWVVAYFEKIKKKIKKDNLCNFLVRTLQCKNKWNFFFLSTKNWKNHPQKLLRKTQIQFFFLTASTAQMAQTEEFMFQNVAYRPTVHRTGLKPISNSKKIYYSMLILAFPLILYHCITYVCSTLYYKAVLLQIIIAIAHDILTGAV